MTTDDRDESLQEDELMQAIAPALLAIEPSPAFAADVRAEIAARDRRRTAWIWASGAVAAAACAAAIGVALLPASARHALSRAPRAENIVSPRADDGRAPSPQIAARPDARASAAAAHGRVATAVGREEHAVPAQGTRIHTHAGDGRALASARRPRAASRRTDVTRAAPERQGAGEAEVEVLVPPDQAIALAQFIAAVRAGEPAPPPIVMARTDDGELQPLPPPPPIEIAPLDIAALHSSDQSQGERQ